MKSSCRPKVSVLKPDHESESSIEFLKNIDGAQFQDRVQVPVPESSPVDLMNSPDCKPFTGSAHLDQSDHFACTI